jgi:hypothetical protein
VGILSIQRGNNRLQFFVSSIVQNRCASVSAPPGRQPMMISAGIGGGTCRRSRVEQEAAAFDRKSGSQRKGSDQPQPGRMGQVSLFR